MNRLAVLIVLASMVFGALVGFAVPTTGGSVYRSGATIVFTAAQVEPDPATASVARHVSQRLPSWAKIAASGAVAGEARLTAGEAITAHEISGAQSLRIELDSPNRDGLADRATAAANTVISVVTRLEFNRVSGVVSDPGGEPENMSRAWAIWAALLGAVLGALLGWLVCSLRRPGRWVAQVADGGSRIEGAEAFAASVDHEILALWAAVRTRRGLLVVGLGFFAVAGYAATGSVGPPFLILLVAGYAAFRDPRWIAGAFLILGASVFPPKLELVKVGPVTPTVLEVALLIGLIAVWRKPGKSIFTWPLVIFVAAVAVGSAYGFTGGGEFSEIADSVRAILLVPLGFVIVYRAFAGKLPQLVALVAVGAAVASAVELLAAVMDWQRLLVDERTSVITGDDTSEVSRLAAPILPLWGPLLILLVSGAFPARPRWRLLLIALPGLAHEALSFNRSTWAPLLGLVVLVAVARFGSRGVVKRLLAAAALGALALGLASGGALGKTGEALAGRVTSVFSGEALVEDSLADRVRENNAALNTLLVHPIVGTGVAVPYGGEIIWYDELHDRTVVEARPWIHNQYLRIWLWFGVFGLFAVGLLMVRVASAVVHSWRLGAPGTVPVVASALGLACMALQSIFQTTLIDRPALVAIALTLAVLALAVGWRPRFEQVGQTPSSARRIMTR
ncbi:O-antigen ligase family protein [Kibdelosporangium philippinense]|uniref:O-antigen ligase family protein n=1 Tax=Kibdelosporangium philippinense TaxID=211113 RepID=A0ABS8ZCA2_9PSEU|nr:O-antigen ligase family protein [Kibdelosporangium philippinense]MCE7005491.1 O-antigen ligase family protein [Kibdelosporangium philippinense]